jgi:hypothetical protein
MVERFFKTGSLRLTTYEKCKTIEDETRQDKNEGKRNYALTQGGYMTAGVQQVGKRCYMLCASMVESEAQMRRFESDSWILIDDVFGFAEAVSRCIPRYASGKMGPARNPPALCRPIQAAICTTCCLGKCSPARTRN